MYITLSSNVCFDGNKISKFRTKLSRTVHLDGEWLVGLSEISYTKSWFNLLESVTITLYDEMGNDYFPKDSSTKSEFTLSAGFYETPQKLVGEINKILMKFTEIQPPKLYYNEINNKVRIIAGKIENSINILPNFGMELEDLLGLRNRNMSKNIYSTDVVTEAHHIFRDKDMYTSDTMTAYHPVEITAGYQSLYIYTDIAYPSLIGDTCAPILRIIEVPRRYKFGETVHINYEKPHYRKLITNSFETIEISIYDDTGNLIPFQFGRVNLTLHMKKL